MALTARQTLFVMEYLADPKKNAKGAAIRAGYSKTFASAEGSTLLKHPEIVKEIERQMRKQVDKFDVDAEMVVRGIMQTITDAKSAGTGAWQAQTIQRGYEMLGRYLGIFSDRVEVGMDERLMAQLAAGRQRAAGLLEEGKEDDGIQEGGGEVARKADLGGDSGSVN